MNLKLILVVMSVYKRVEHTESGYIWVYLTN